MTTTAPQQARRLHHLRLLQMRRPETGAAAIIAFAWLTLLLLGARAAHTGGTTPGMAGMPDMDMPVPAGSPQLFPPVAAGLPYWTLMTVAMMGPAALAGIRHTGLHSLHWRRGRAMTGYAAAYLTVWIIYGAVALVGIALVPDATQHGLLSVVLAMAAAWQLSPYKRRFLRDCHRSQPLPLRGWPAERGVLRFGLRNGLACLGSCWCLMLAMTITPGPHLLWTAALTMITTTERLAPQPRRTTRLAAAALGAAAVAAALANHIR